MSCPNCTIVGQKITFTLPSNLHQAVSEHFKRHNYTTTLKEDQLETDENGARDLYDFLTQIELTEGVTFRINNQPWLKLDQFHQYLDAAWVDDIISERFINMHFQPIILPDGTIYAYEMLARFTDKDGKIVYPDTLFPAAKLRGRTFALDRICRVHAVKQTTRLKKHQKAFINFIPTAIYTPQFCLRTTTMVAEQMGIDSDRFVFEVVETEKVEDLNHLKSILSYYQSHGFHYALDDVGSGFNTLNVLKEINPPYIKLDMSIVQGVSTCEKKQRIAQAILDHARAYQSVTLAEGVETIEDFHWLKEAGFALFQGYLFGKPLSEVLDEDQIDLEAIAPH